MTTVCRHCNRGDIHISSEDALFSAIRGGMGTTVDARKHLNNGTRVRFDDQNKFA